MNNEGTLPKLRAKTNVQVYLPNLGVIEEGQTIDVSEYGKDVWQSLLDNSPFEIYDEEQTKLTQEEELDNETITRI